MSEFSKVKRSALPLVLTAGLLMSACGKTDKPEGKVSGIPSSPGLDTKPQLHLPLNPPDVSLDAYDNGRRTVTFKARYPQLLLQVVELCNDDVLVEETQSITAHKSRHYREVTYLNVFSPSVDCAGDQLTQGALDTIPLPLTSSKAQPPGIAPPGQPA